MKEKKVVFLIFILHMTLFGFAESFRVHKTVMLPVREQNISSRAQLEVNDVLVLTLPAKSFFFTGN